MKINQFYKHVDNGGIFITIESFDNIDDNIKIIFEADYYGYPSVSATLNVTGMNSAQFLKDFSKFLEKTSEKMLNKKTWQYDSVNMPHNSYNFAP